eukprot:gb/GFBE01051690.1/.p1 GENE.gb/GFBE01051690.1/~~gb/GFBE01051690.1/.p1  ORF type:complete len:220 (+),score=42.08 gb/GFBE01051690.1/:1-660(+)
MPAACCFWNGYGCAGFEGATAWPVPRRHRPSTATPIDVLHRLRSHAGALLLTPAERPARVSRAQAAAFLEGASPPGRGRCAQRHSFLDGDADEDSEVGDVEEKAVEDKEDMEQKEFQLDKVPKTCRIEMKRGERRACEAKDANLCMDDCSRHYRDKREGEEMSAQDRQKCYNACIDHCVLGRKQDGTVRPQCPIVNGVSERYTTWETYSKLVPEQEIGA